MMREELTKRSCQVKNFQKIREKLGLSIHPPAYFLETFTMKKPHKKHNISRKKKEIRDGTHFRVFL